MEIRGLGQNFSLRKLFYVAQALSKTTFLLPMKEIDLDVEMLSFNSCGRYCSRF